MKKLFISVVIFILIVPKLSAQTFSRIQAENWSAMSGVQTENTSDVGGGLDVGWIDPGDWMEYSISRTTAGSYRIDLRIATANTGAQVQIKNSAGTVLKTVDIPTTFGFQSWRTVTTYIPLTAGTQTIRFQSSSPSGITWNCNWLDVSETVTTKIEAESYTAMNGIATETTSDAGYGMNVGWIDPGDWMDYSYTAPFAGSYTVNLRVATPNTGAQFLIKNSAGTTLSTVSVPVTGAYQTYQTTTTTITLAAGAQTIRVQGDAVPRWNFNWFEIVAPAGSGGTNQPPTLNAGVDQTITLPTSQVSLIGTASDVDGSISTYAWTKVSGPAAGTITSASSATTTVTGLTEGTYVFRLTVTDNGGASAYDDLSVTVNAAPVSGGWSLSGNAATATQFIGTTNTQDLLFKAGNHSWARLTTLGVFEANKIKVRADGWADYVFDPSYRLRPLSEVQQFINKYRHLPDVPSERQVKEQGLNVGDNQAVLLRKIEELTLYLLEQNKKLEQQAEEIRQLKKQVKAKTKK